MLAGLVLNTVGLSLFCRPIFALAVYALPFFVAVRIGMSTFHSGTGVIGALLVGIFAGASTLVVGLATTRSTILRAAFGAVFAVPGRHRQLSCGSRDVTDRECVPGLA